MGPPHSKTLARHSQVQLPPQGLGVRQPHAAFDVRTKAGPIAIRAHQSGLSFGAEPSAILRIFFTPAFMLRKWKSVVPLIKLFAPACAQSATVLKSTPPST